MPGRNRSTPAQRGAEVFAITAILMISIGTTGKLVFDDFDLGEMTGGAIMLAWNLALAYVLLRWYHARHAHSQPPPVHGPRPAPRYTPAQQAYIDNPSARASCRHLQPVESLIRNQGVLAYPLYSSALVADCRIDEAALRRVLTLDPCVWYDEYLDDRDRTASLGCKECKFSISARHPSLGGALVPADQ